MKRLPAYNPMRNAKKNSIYASQKGMPVGLSNYDASTQRSVEPSVLYEIRGLIKKNSHNGLTMKRLHAYNPMRNAKKNSIYASQKGMPVGLSNYDGIKLRLSSGSISVSCCILEYRFQKTWVSDITA
ncbi:hypothetical protein T4A_3851 [Trichinella pseudospiralis]|uniref:Uncharacterized protein n=1 Tax=Trichinella pseudospiralis TaxID=6337 RepID=A0A0V1DZ63_TRIPS|nr:hypothetical protein T4A_3851 [Trichinella pseudospiralis]